MVSRIHSHVLLSQTWADKTWTTKVYASFSSCKVVCNTVLRTYAAHGTAVRKGGLGIRGDISRQNKMTEGKGSYCHIESGLNCGIWSCTLLAWTLDTEVERESLCLVIAPCSVSGKENWVGKK